MKSANVINLRQSDKYSSNFQNASDRGAQLLKLLRRSDMFCPKCGTQIAQNGSFCPNCGASVGTGAGAPPTPPPAPGYAPAQSYAPAAGATSDKDWEKTFLLAYLPGLLGVFGIDRIYSGNLLLGILKLVTCGGCGIWAIIDIVLLALGTYKDGSGNLVKPPVIPGAPADGKDWKTTFLLALFLGWLGIDRFYSGHTLLGVLKLFTCGGCGIWILVDVVMLANGAYKDSNGFPLIRKA
jgi:TM2 domain-containing membrane protein YozV